MPINTNSTNYNKIFIDLDLNMEKNEITKDVKIKTGKSAVAQSIKNIVLTSRGERPFNRDFGFGMYQQLFEVQDPIFLGDIKMRLAATINQQERRVFVSGNDISINSNGNEVTINIVYNVKGPYTGSVTEQQELTIALSTGN